MSKSLWFPFYTADFLSSPDVQDMEAHEVGAYVLLLARSWQSDSPGYLENDEQAIRRAARLNATQWAESRTIVLKKWPLVEGNDKLRHNRRLVHEAETAVELREKKAEAGRKSAERRAQIATQRQQTGNTNPTPVEIPATDVGQNANQLQPQLQLHSTSVEEEREAPTPEPSPLKAETGGQKLVGSAAPNPARQQAIAVGDGSGELNWDESPLTKPHGFKAICEGNGYPGIDYEHYRKQALDAARNENPARPRTASQWRSWVRKYLNFESKGGPLLQPSANMPTVPTPKHELPQPGKEREGQVIAIQGVPGDQNMNRMLVAAYQQQFPTATIHAIVPRSN